MKVCPSVVEADTGDSECLQIGEVLYECKLSYIELTLNVVVDYPFF